MLLCVTKPFSQLYYKSHLKQICLMLLVKSMVQNKFQQSSVQCASKTPHWWIMSYTMANVKYDELKALIESNKELVLIDVRSDGEVAGGIIPGAIHIPINTLDSALSMNPDDFKAKYGIVKPPLNVPQMVFYCQSGGRSMMATRKAVNKGYTNARNYAGAYSEWSRKERK